MDQRQRWFLKRNISIIHFESPSQFLFRVARLRHVSGQHELLTHSWIIINTEQKIFKGSLNSWNGKPWSQWSHCYQNQIFGIFGPQMFWTLCRWGRSCTSPSSCPCSAARRGCPGQHGDNQCHEGCTCYVITSINPLNHSVISAAS